MIYRRDPRFRRYSASVDESIPQPSGYEDDRSGGISRDIDSIPLPNEKDETAFPNLHESSRKTSRPGIFTRRIQADEIILLVLIFLLIEEHIDDDFLLIILIYLLVSEIIEEQFRSSQKPI
ncbi:MAG TPA: hypothetical protein PLA01_10060 [Acetivibrio sp.]|nr:hypothetical protein [Acetivibrio sp.]